MVNLGSGLSLASVSPNKRLSNKMRARCSVSDPFEIIYCRLTVLRDAIFKGVDPPVNESMVCHTIVYVYLCQSQHPNLS